MMRHTWSCDVIEVLLQAGATPLACCDAGKTAMHDLCWSMNCEDEADGAVRCIRAMTMLAEWRSPDAAHVNVTGPNDMSGDVLMLMQDRLQTTPLEYLQAKCWRTWNQHIHAQQPFWWPMPHEHDDTMDVAV
jgi:hypothetical protein